MHQCCHDISDPLGEGFEGFAPNQFETPLDYVRVQYFEVLDLVAEEIHSSLAEFSFILHYFST